MIFNDMLLCSSGIKKGLPTINQRFVNDLKYLCQLSVINFLLTFMRKFLELCSLTNNQLAVIILNKLIYFHCKLLQEYQQLKVHHQSHLHLQQGDFQAL